MRGCGGRFTKMMNNTSLTAIREESSGLSSNDEYEDVTDDESEGDDGRIELQSKLQLTGNQARMEGLKVKKGVLIISWGE